MSASVFRYCDVNGYETLNPSVELQAEGCVAAGTQYPRVVASWPQVMTDAEWTELLRLGCTLGQRSPDS